MDRYKKVVNFNQDNINNERVNDWNYDISDNSGYLPMGVTLEDIDNSFLSMVKDDFAPNIERINQAGTKVVDVMPVVFFSTQRWYEFSKTYDITSNEFKDISFPFISVLRNTDVQVGTINDSIYNIPGRRTWMSLKVPNMKNGIEGVDIYKIPYPTAIDVTYEIRVFTTQYTQQNLFVEKLHKAYNSIQKYIMVNNYAMPTTLEGISDESQLELEDRKLLITTYEITLKGYLLDIDDFEVIEGISRTKISVNTSLNNKQYGRNMRVKKNTVLFSFKDKKVLSILKPNESYKLSRNVNVFDGTIEEFCKSVKNDYEGC